MCVVLSGAAAPSGAQAQAQRQGNQDSQWNIQPFIPPVLPLPPNAQWQPGTSTYQSPNVGDPPQLNNSQSLPPSGLRITIPNR
jgi:hypothetical protein